LIKYFTSREFVEFNKILEDRIKNNKIEEEKELQSLKLKKGLKIPSFLIYIPYINIIFVFIKNSKYNFHIKN
jgi:hypothetical protein